VQAAAAGGYDALAAAANEFGLTAVVDGPAAPAITDGGCVALVAAVVDAAVTLVAVGGEVACCCWCWSCCSCYCCY
jgi:hypothetical protein